MQLPHTDKILAIIKKIKTQFDLQQENRDHELGNEEK